MARQGPHDGGYPRRCAPSTSAPRTSPCRSCGGWPSPRTGPSSWSRGPTARRAAGASCSPRRSPTRRAADGAAGHPARQRELRRGARADRGREPDEVVICAFGALIKEPLLSEHPMLNVHPSLLPRWRGAAPIERAIEAGDATTGVCIMRPIAEMDAGPVCLCEEVDQARRRLRLAVAAPGRPGRRAAGQGARRGQPSAASSPSDGHHRGADKITADDRRLDPDAGAGRAGPPGARAQPARGHPGSSCPAATGWACAGDRGRIGGDAPPRARSPRSTADCSTAWPTRRSSCSRSSRRAAARWRPPRGCAATARRSSADAGGAPSPTASSAASPRDGAPGPTGPSAPRPSAPASTARPRLRPAARLRHRAAAAHARPRPRRGVVAAARPGSTRALRTRCASAPTS